MRDSRLNRLAGFVALAAFTAYGAGAFSSPPDVGVQQPGDSLHLWLLPPELPVGQVPILVEQHRLSETPSRVMGAALATANPSRGPPA